jgi:hypothetical protein
MRIYDKLMIDSVFPLALFGYIVASVEQTHVHDKALMNSAVKTDKTK